jgi:hypothetical protein
MNIEYPRFETIAPSKHADRDEDKLGTHLKRL